MQASTIRLLLGQNAFPGRLQASTDGVNFGMIGRFPDLREGVAVELWGIDPADVGASAASASEEPAPDQAQSAAPPVAPAPGMPPGAANRPARAPAPGVPPGAANRPARPPAPGKPPGAAAGQVRPPGSKAPTEPEVFDPSALAPEESAFDPSALAPEEVAFDPSALAAKQPGSEEAMASVAEELPASGDLREVSAFRLAYLVFAAKETCRIDIESSPKASLFFQKGAPVHAVSQDPGLDVGAWLVRLGALTADAKNKAEEAAPNFGGSFTGALFASGLADPGAVFPHLAALGKEVWIHSLTRPSGSFRINLGEAPPPDAIPLGIKTGILLAEAARRVDLGALNARMGRKVRAPVMRSNASVMDLNDLGLGPQEARIAAMLDGVRAPLELAEDSGTDLETTLRVAWLLGECGFVAFAQIEDALDSPEPVDPPPPEPPSAPPPVEQQAEAPPKPAEAQVNWEEEEKKVAALEKKWKSVDNFRLLGVSPQCGDEEIKAAYTALMRKYHPDRAAMAPPEVQAIYRRLFDRLQAANAAVGNPAKRRAYMNEIAEKETARPPAPAGGEDAIVKVRHLVKSRDYDEAVALLDEALAVNPGLAAGWAWRALLKILRTKDAAAVRGEATSMIERALQLDPRSREVHLLAARIAKHFGDAAAFARHEQQAKALTKK